MTGCCSPTTTKTHLPPDVSYQSFRKARVGQRDYYLPQKYDKRIRKHRYTVAEVLALFDHYRNFTKTWAEIRPTVVKILNGDFYPKEIKDIMADQGYHRQAKILNGFDP